MTRENEIKRSMEIKKLVALQADNTDFYNKAKERGEAAYEALRDNGKSQIRNLENIANNATKVSDVLDYIKKQTAKCKLDKSWRFNSFGPNLVQYIEKDLRQAAGRVEGGLEPQPDEYERQRIRLMLLREFIRQMGTHFLYRECER